MVITSSRTTTSLASHVVRVLRTESGYLQERLGVVGMDKQQRSRNTSDLVSLGLEMVQRLGSLQPTRLQYVLMEDVSGSSRAIILSQTLLALAMRPVENETLLIGLALAFLDFESAAATRRGLLSTTGQEALQQIVNRKHEVFKDCLIVLRGNENKIQACFQHYVTGRTSIEEALK